MTNKTTSTIHVALGSWLVAAAAVFGQAPEPVSPGAPGAVSRITSACPTFSWGIQPGAARHELLVYRIPETAAVEPGAIDTALSPEAEMVSQIELPGSASSWTPPADLCLTAGDTYAWTIRSHGAETSTEWAEARLFSVDERAEMSEIEAAIERVLDRYLEQQRIDAATAEALRADPTPLVGAAEAEPAAPTPAGHVILDPVGTAIEAELTLDAARQIAILGETRGRDNSAGVLGESKNPLGLNFGVVGLTVGNQGGAAGVVGEVEEDPLGPPAGPRYGVRGLSPDVSSTSAGVRGDGDKGVLGVGDSNSTSAIGVMGIVGNIDFELPNGDQTLETFYNEVVGVQTRTGVFGFGKRGVVGVTNDDEGVGGRFENRATSGTAVGLFVNGGPSEDAFDMQLGKGRIKLLGANDTLTLIKGTGTGLAKFEADGSSLQGVQAANTDEFVNETPAFFLKTNDSRTVQSGVTLTFASGSKLHFGTPPSGSPLLYLPTTGIDGAGPNSGLNADKLDGIDSAAFITNPPGVALNMGGQSILNIGSPNSATFNSDGTLTLNNTLASTLSPSLTGSITTLGGIGAAQNISVGTQVDLAQGSSIQNPAFSLVRLRDNPSLSERILDFDLQSPGGLLIAADDESTNAHAGASLTLQSEDGVGSGGGQKGGDLILRAGDAQALASSEVGGDVILNPGRGGTPTSAALEGKVNITGTQLVLDSDGAITGTDSDIVIVATQGADTNLSGGLRYNSINDKWEIKNGSAAYQAILTGGGAGSNIDADTLDGLDSTAFATLDEGEILNNATNHIFHFEDAGAIDPTGFTLDLDLETGISFLGSGGPDSNGADFDLKAGDAASPGGGSGGDFTINAGKSRGGGALQGGTVTITAGAGFAGTLAPGGDVFLSAAPGTGSMQPGGKVSIAAGNGGTGDANGGDIILDPGNKNSSGIDGKVLVEGDLKMGTTPKAITGASSVTAATLASTTTSGAPMTVASNVKVSMLNADLLDGESAEAFADASHTHAGGDINTGTVAEARIDSAIARDTEVASTYLALAGGNMTGNLSATPGTGPFSIVGTNGDPGVGIAIEAGDNTGTGAAPDVTVTAGSTAGSGENGGDIVLTPGSPGTGGADGKVIVKGDIRAMPATGSLFTLFGADDNPAVAVKIKAGDNDTDGEGADVTIAAGAAAGTNNDAGGDIFLTPGAGIGSGAQGKVIVAGELTGASSVSAATLTSTVSDGTAPLTVTSMTKVTNLNADKLDGNDAGAFATSGHTHTGSGDFLKLDGTSTMIGDIAGDPTSDLFSLVGATGNPAVAVKIKAGDNDDDGNGADVTIASGAAAGTDNDGGDIFLTPGAETGAGAPGKVVVEGGLQMGTTPQAITGALSVGAATLTSTVADGTAPLNVTSTTKVANLNADRLDGSDATAFATSTHSHTEFADFLKLDGTVAMTGNISGTAGPFTLAGTDGAAPIAVKIKAGSNDTAGNGADVTIESGVGAGSGDNGGDILLTPGASGGGAGVPGRVIVAADRLFQLPVFTASATCTPATLGAIYLKNNDHIGSEADSLCVCIDGTADTMDNPTLVDLSSGTGC